MAVQQKQVWRSLTPLLPIFASAFVLAAVLACFPTLALARKGSGQHVTGVVTHVTDGDTFWVRTAQHTEPRKVRIQGIDAPESCQPGGAQASAALKAHVLGQTVQLQSKAYDDYGRVLARVSLNGQDVGAWMVANGHA